MYTLMYICICTYIHFSFDNDTRRALIVVFMTLFWLHFNTKRAYYKKNMPNEFDTKCVLQ